MKELRIYNIPDELFQKLEEKAKELNLSTTQYALSLIGENTEALEKTLAKVSKKFDNINIAKVGEQFLLQQKYKKLLDYYKSETIKLANEIEHQKLVLDTMITIDRFGDILAMIEDYLKGVESEERLTQILDEIKALKQKVDEIAIIQGVRIKRVVRP